MLKLQPDGAADDSSHLDYSSRYLRNGLSRQDAHQVSLQSSAAPSFRKAALDVDTRGQVSRHVLPRILHHRSRTAKAVRIRSRRYIDAALANLPPAQLHLNTPVAAVGNSEDGKVRLRLADGREEKFDHVIMASQSHQTLRMLQAGGGTTWREQSILSKIRWSQNETVLHSDTRVWYFCARCFEGPTKY